jgi:hypothetical protein
VGTHELTDKLGGSHGFSLITTFNESKKILDESRDDSASFKRSTKITQSFLKSTSEFSRTMSHTVSADYLDANYWRVNCG